MKSVRETTNDFFNNKDRSSKHARKIEVQAGGVAHRRWTPRTANKIKIGASRSIDIS